MPARRDTPAIELSAEPLSRLPGVGPRVAEKLAARGLVTMQDLWLHLPLRYEDRTAITPIRLLQFGMGGFEAQPFVLGVAARQVL